VTIFSASCFGVYDSSGPTLGLDVAAETPRTAPLLPQNVTPGSLEKPQPEQVRASGHRHSAQNRRPALLGVPQRGQVIAPPHLRGSLAFRSRRTDGATAPPRPLPLHRLSAGRHLPKHRRSRRLTRCGESTPERPQAHVRLVAAHRNLARLSACPGQLGRGRGGRILPGLHQPVEVLAVEEEFPEFSAPPLLGDRQGDTDSPDHAERLPFTQRPWRDSEVRCRGGQVEQSGRARRTRLRCRRSGPPPSACGRRRRGRACDVPWLRSPRPAWFTAQADAGGREWRRTPTGVESLAPTRPKAATDGLSSGRAAKLRR